MPDPGRKGGVIGPLIDPDFSPWLAVSVSGVIASGRHLLDAECLGDRHSAWIPDLAELLLGVA